MNDHDLLIRLDEKISEVLRRMDGQDGTIGRLEGRLRALENFRWWILGASAAIGAVASYIFKLVTQ